ncbi:hypothetical protein TRVL_05620 [Trypanosoma vivax]|uniref:Uncharacterized protein n=1 Tax=Trypanosoma vivax (strain Y486) TaxID=1055687 RepID=G0U2M1_TRYVY|nr:hypothetical protein TRVL_05620 [Trypanosoma vivax]CCC50524.1 hypothetical protein TVY486_0903450 [Trypanosoma vivax Y486]
MFAHTCAIARIIHTEMRNVQCLGTCRVLHLGVFASAPAHLSFPAYRGLMRRITPPPLFPFVLLIRRRQHWCLVVPLAGWSGAELRRYVWQCPFKERRITFFFLLGYYYYLIA